MGYYSTHGLTMTDLNTKEELTKGKLLEDIFDAMDEDEVLSIPYLFEGNETRCNIEGSMLALPHRFPNVLFDVFRQGEEADDSEHIYFLNGQCQHCEAVITYPPFDPLQFKDCIPDTLRIHIVDALVAGKVSLPVLAATPQEAIAAFERQVSDTGFGLLSDITWDNPIVEADAS